MYFNNNPQLKLMADKPEVSVLMSLICTNTKIQHKLVTHSYLSVVSLIQVHQTRNAIAYYSDKLLYVGKLSVVCKLDTLNVNTQSDSCVVTQLQELLHCGQR